MGIAFILIVLFSSCESLGKYIVINKPNSESNPGARVYLGGLQSTETNDTSRWSFDRDESTGQFYIEFYYRIRTSSSPTNNLSTNLMTNVTANLDSKINVNNILLKIDNSREITLNGSPVPRSTNPTFRFPVSEDIANQLLNCNNFTIQAVSQDIHEVHRLPCNILERGIEIISVKRFINHWINEEAPVNLAVANAETQRSNTPPSSTSSSNTNQANATQTEESQPNERNTRDRSLRRYDNERRLPFPYHPPNCCHNVGR